MPKFYRRLKTQWLYALRSVVRHRSLILRAIFCWLIGAILFLTTSSHNFDRRFQVRQAQALSDQIVLILISEEEWANKYHEYSDWMRPLKELTPTSDSFFWDTDAWPEILGKVLNEDPRAVAVSFYFGDNILTPSLELLENKSLNDPKVIWASRLDSSGRVLTPLFMRYYNQNTGLIDLKSDADGLVRTFNSPLVQFKHLSTMAVDVARGSNALSHPKTGETRYINFRGRRGTFPSISLKQLLDGNFPDDYFKEKIVFIGSGDTNGHLFRTPVGNMSRVEVLANISENIISDQWVQRTNNFVAFGLLILLVVLATWIMSTYSQFVALVFLVWLGAVTSALSLWAFDKHYYWIPIISPLGLLATSYVTFLSFRLTIRDYENWRLEHQNRVQEESERLKSNFVSLISHDLKTPIAKIQAICDRILTQGAHSELARDLSYLRQESSELHRYIQSILQITKVESANFKLNKDAADLNDIAESVKSQLDPLAANKGIRLHTELEPMFLVELDQILIHEVILNLVENAIKYTPENGDVEISTQEINDRVVLQVKDNGPGIPAEEQQQIFDKFYRSRSHATEKGSGLGLYLVKYFIELHGGHVFVHSQPGSGTKIGFDLPISEEETAASLSEYNSDQIGGSSYGL